MKKALFILFAILVSYTGYAQDAKDTYYDGIEYSKDLGITADQKRRIIAIKKTIGRRHAEIGKSGLRGYEKGEAHRKLNMQIRKEINDILNENQRENWQKKSPYTSYDKYEKYSDVECQIDALEDKIDDMEDYYDRKIDALEDDYTMSKADRKYKKKQLKAERDAKKSEMKRQIKTLKNSRGY